MLRPRYPLMFLISLLVAASLWYALARTRLAQMTEKPLTAPIVLVDVPEAMILTVPPPQSAEVVIRGPLDKVRDLEASGGLEILISLAGLEPGSATRTIDESSLRLPESLRLISVEPSSFDLEVDRRTVREIRVDPDIFGAPAEGFQVVAVRSRPSTVSVTGPAGVIDQLQGITSTSIEIQGATTPLQAQVQLRSPGPRTLLSPSTATVFIEVRRIPAPIEASDEPE